VSGNQAKVQELRQQEEQRRLSREDMLSARILEESYFIEALGGTVLIKSLSLRERTTIRKAAKANTPEFDEELLEVLSIIYSVKDPALTEEDVDAIRDMDSNIIDELNLHISIMNMAGYSGKDSREMENFDSPSPSVSVSE